jgi:hypothetical protein
METGRTLGAFIFKEILCCWGAVKEIITNNGTAYVTTLDWLASRYGINHICISAYNSQANGIVEWQHYTIRKSLVKTCEGNVSLWPVIVPHIFWANRATIQKSTGYSPYYMAHGVKPLLPFDITLATFLVPNMATPLSTAELIAIHACQLQKREDNLARIKDNILAACLTSVWQFERQFENTIQTISFKPGDLVLVRNSAVEMDLGHKMKPRYFRPMVVICKTCSGSYWLAELNSAISKLQYAVFCLVLYLACSRTSIPITWVLDHKDLATVIQEEAADPEIDEEDAWPGTVKIWTPGEM